MKKIAKIHPTEIIINDLSFVDQLRNIATIGNTYINESFNESYLSTEILNEYFSDEYLSRLRFDENNLIKTSLCILLNYIYNTQSKLHQILT